jgi:ubiquinone/menaquinone biosynthesis C-methylase UbiE
MTIEDAYNEWSKQYDHTQNKTRDLDAIATRKTLSAYSFSTVIELGCGTGKNTRFFLEKADWVIGIDFSENMLEKAREKYSGEKVEFRKGDLTKNWNLKNQCADLITCHLLLEHIKDLDVVYSQAYETLKPGGLFFVSELHPFKQYLGSKARYDINGVTKELETYTHHTSEYLTTAARRGFNLVEFNEWFDGSNEENIPRLIGILLRK